MIKSLKIGNLRNSEFVRFFSLLITIVQKFDPEKLGIKEQLDPIIPDHNKVEELHGQSKKNKYTKEKEELDDDRDECIVGISQVISGYTHHYDETLKEAAESLLAKIEVYGNSIANQNYPTETTSLKGITDAFTTEEVYINALKKLHLTGWNQQMKEKNDLFEKLDIANIEEGAMENEDKIKDLRKNIGKNYAELKKHINAHFILTPDNYEPLMAQINKLIDEYDLLLSRRKSGNKISEEAEVEDM